MRRWVTSLLLVLAACVGDDPQLTAPPGSSPDAGLDGDPNGDAAASAPLLELQAQPLVLVAGTSDVLQIKVVRRRDVGEVSFEVKGLPEGVSAPGIVTLSATADVINIPLTSASSTTHGDFVVTIAAQGTPFGAGASASLVVRGTAGAQDTGFGAGGSVLVPALGGAEHVAVLSDERVVVGTTYAGKPVLTIVDAKGGILPAINVTQTGTLRGLAPTADGGFVILVVANNALRMVGFSKDGVEAPPGLEVSTNTTAIAAIAPTPKGTLFAQAKTGAGIFVGRYVAGTADPAFPPVTVPASDNQAGLRFLSGAVDGSAWVGMQSGMSQDQLARVPANQQVVTSPLVPTETCSRSTTLVDDLIAYCTNDQPSFTLRRFKPDGTPETSFGTQGRLAIDSANLDGLLSHGSDRLYVSRTINTPSNTRRLVAYDGKGAARTVFATNGVLDVAGADARPVVAVDPRGRLVFVSSEQTMVSNVRVSRYWD